MHVTVKASDNGRPSLEDVCTLAVKINDVNDNSPVFDRANYGVPIAQVSSVIFSGLWELGLKLEKIAW